MILFAEFNFFLKIEPFASWYFPIVWFGYIFVIDAIVYKIKNHSLISNKPRIFITLLLMSMAFWWLFEVINLAVKNWTYTETSNIYKLVIFGSLSFSTVLPAVFETLELLRAIRLFDNVKLKESHRITKRFLHVMIWIGIISLVLFLLFPRYFFPLVWIAFFFLLDPINYLHNQPSIIEHLKDRKLAVPLSIFLAATICGFFWEFWNYWAAVKWFYTIPLVDFFRIFEMPILGYFGYGPFGFSLFSMYNFFKTLNQEAVKLEEKLVTKYIDKFKV